MDNFDSISQWIGILFFLKSFCLLFVLFISFPCIHVSMVYNSRSFNVDVCSILLCCMLVISVFDTCSLSVIYYLSILSENYVVTESN